MVWLAQPERPVRQKQCLVVARAAVVVVGVRVGVVAWEGVGHSQWPATPPLGQI